jgi:hypothetical protein
MLRENEIKIFGVNLDFYFSIQENLPPVLIPNNAKIMYS